MSLFETALGKGADYSGRRRRNRERPSEKRVLLFGGAETAFSDGLCG
ncbi:hypothetical protein HMPREF9123_2612 [Neisseria bacilliformis ATCC BAA-1200]|uniref:Uncharacterized protein n=1 Tax=Neisseria bacilliformis ATCC BAA-1200 TaxID=888742 RepID=F2BFV5_9NEIS|nr:hypothetical protein HMPREF9123_2612 [Neisseria bacilliformis ATCC BAA-1200]